MAWYATLVPSSSSTLPESSSAVGALDPSTKSPSVAGCFIPKPQTREILCDTEFATLYRESANCLITLLRPAQ